MIVSNTTPLSNLLRLRQLRLLGALWGRVTIPAAVARELDQGAAVFGDWRIAAGSEAIEVVSIQPDPLIRQFLLDLHEGEAEALALAIRRGATLLLVDDMDARRTAGHHQIAVTGTLGVLLLAKRRGLIESVTPYLDRLRQEVHFWFSEQLYQDLRKLAGEG